MELQIELDSIEYNNDTYSGVLIIEGSIETDCLSGEAWGRSFSHETRGFEVQSSTLFIDGHDGEELATIEDPDLYSYVTEEQIQEAAIS